MLNKRGAAGVDGETIRQYEVNLEANVSELHARLRAGQYKAPPVRRVEIPKGEGKVRMLGIPTVEDRLLQAAVARILSAIYEPIFLECSYGYRPKRSAHDALRCLRSHLIGGKVMQIFEADIRAYFDRVNHNWLRQMLKVPGRGRVGSGFSGGLSFGQHPPILHCGPGGSQCGCGVCIHSHNRSFPVGSGKGVCRWHLFFFFKPSGSTQSMGSFST